MFASFESISSKGKILKVYCSEYEEYASDKDEKDLIVDTEAGIEGFLRSVSTKQAEQIDSRIKQLKVLFNDFQIALNKDEIKQDAFQVISQIEKILAAQQEKIENGWSSL